ncbi:MAG TPA: PQQ-dependent sugar dehydrogenase [Candidatus Dormibacteraeota bacterium]|jgi:glucose/arabinose dehydrogenase
MRRRTSAPALLLIGLILSACTSGGTSTTPSATAKPTATPSPTPITAAGPLNFTVKSVAEGLVAPWALAFATDGSVWLTERPGRVRVIRNGQLLPTAALTLNVVTANGCEDGLLGIAVREPNVFLYYTFRGSGGNTNRISKFTIQGNTLVGEQVLLDGIPGGTCYHFGGRLKIGPDGYLYATTGEGYVASRAASPTGLSGKILRLHLDGSGMEVFAWGFRNPQGIAFDSAGRLYASSNGPTGDLGLCCHDEIDYVQQGGFYGWPEFAATVRTGYGQDGMPAQRSGPIANSGTSTWAPSGITFYSPRAHEQATLLVATLRGQALRRFIIDAADPNKVDAQQVVLQGKGRLRDVVAGPDHCAYVLTNNRDTRGTPQAGDDHLFQLCPS